MNMDDDVDFIDYGHLIDDAMHIIVKKVLERVAKEGLPGKHHFFISFATKHAGVKISKELRGKYSEEITIVLQHQFDELKVNDSGFSVVLSFDNVKERIEVPFDALVAFADPSVKFGLQFRHLDEFDDMEDENLPEVKKSPSALGKKGKAAAKKDTKKKKGKKKDTDNVIDIDSFRKK